MENLKDYKEMAIIYLLLTVISIIWVIDFEPKKLNVQNTNYQKEVVLNY